MKYSSKLNKIASNFVIAKATLVPSKFNILEKNELKNSYFRKITEDFILVKNAEIGEIKELANFVTPFKNGNIFMPKNWESFFSKVEKDNAEKFENEKIQKSQKIPFFIYFYQIKQKHGSKNGFCSQRPLNLKNVRFDKMMPRTSRLLLLNLREEAIDSI